MGRPTGIEPATPRSTIWCSNRLSYGRRGEPGKLRLTLFAVNLDSSVLHLRTPPKMGCTRESNRRHPDPFCWPAECSNRLSYGRRGEPGKLRLTLFAVNLDSSVLHLRTPPKMGCTRESNRRHPDPFCWPAECSNRLSYGRRGEPGKLRLTLFAVNLDSSVSASPRLRRTGRRTGRMAPSFAPRIRLIKSGGNVLLRRTYGGQFSPAAKTGVPAVAPEE